MKSKKKKYIKRIAEQIVKLEQQCMTQPTKLSETQNKMEQLIMGLSLEDMLAIDNYILEKKLLTKWKIFDIIYM